MSQFPPTSLGGGGEGRGQGCRGWEGWRVNLEKLMEASREAPSARPRPVPADAA